MGALAWLASLLLRRPAAPPPLPAPPPTDRWPECVAWILEREGGYVNNPSDPGGATNMGITAATLSVHLGRPATVADVRDMRQETAEAIYFHDYWLANRCDEMPPGVDLTMLDCVVMSGPSRPRRWLQAALSVAQDGVLGPETMAALSHADRHQVIQGLTAARLQYYQGLATWDTFGRGWTSRIEATHMRATGMAVA